MNLPLHLAFAATALIWGAILTAGHAQDAPVPEQAVAAGPAIKL
jgi:hypothetical protein